MILKDITIADVEKASSILIGLATAGFQIYSQIKQNNPNMTLDQFVEGIKQAQGIPTDWNDIYPEDTSG
jgi:hypothetical protein